MTIKLRSYFKSFLILTLVLSGLGVVAKSVFAATPQERIVCESIIYAPSTIELIPDSDGTGYQPVQVTVTIVVSGMLVTDLDALQFAVDPPDSGWQWYHLEREPEQGQDGREGVIFQPVAGQPGQFTTSLNITVDEAGPWATSLEVRDGQRHLSATGGPGCNRDHRGEFGMFSAVLDPDFSPEGEVYDQGCGFLDSDVIAQLNHFTCATLGSGSYYVDQDQIYCNEAQGYEPNFNACIQGTLNSAGFDVCAPCVTAQQAEDGQVPHLGVCVLDSEDPAERCEPIIRYGGPTGTTRAILDCLPINNPQDIQSRCLYTANVQQPGDSCYLGANECDVNTNCIHDPGSDTPSWQGECTATPQQECTRVEECRAPVSEGGQGGSMESECVAGRCLEPCEEGHSVPPGSVGCPGVEPPSDPGPDDDDVDSQFDPSTDYGIRNCPYGFGANFTAEQQQEHISCLRCVSGVNSFQDFLTALGNLGSQGTFYVPGQAGTWTALGCINTSPEGVFAFLVRLALGVLGGIVLLRFIYLGYIYQTGNEGKIEEAKKGIWSTIGAILVVVFSVVALQFIGVNILDVVPVGFFASGG